MINALLDITLNDDDGLPNLVCKIVESLEGSLLGLENHTWGRKSLKGMRNRLMKI